MYSLLLKKKLNVIHSIQRTIEIQNHLALQFVPILLDGLMTGSEDEHCFFMVVIVYGSAPSVTFRGDKGLAFIGLRKN